MNNAEERNIKIKAAERTAFIGEYYFSEKLKEVARMRANGADIINLGIGSPDLQPHKDVIDTLVNHVQSPKEHGYSNYEGILPLRKAFADWYAEYFRVDLTQDEVLPLMGSKEGILYIALAFLDEGDTVLVPNPGYPAYYSLAKLAGAHVKTYDLNEQNNWQPDWDSIYQHDLNTVKMIFTNYPNMPTGARAQRQTLEELVALGLKHNTLICNDNPYSFILNNDYQSILSVPGAWKTAIELNSLSKSHNMAGWRIGAVLGDSFFIKEILKVKSNANCNFFVPMQHAAVTALAKGDEWYSELNAVYSERRKLAEELLELLGCAVDKQQTGLFLWAKIPVSYSNGSELADELLYRANIFVTPGFIFGSKGEHYIRISLCADEAAFTEALHRVKQRIQTKNRQPDSLTMQ